MRYFAIHHLKITSFNVTYFIMIHIHYSSVTKVFSINYNSTKHFFSIRLFLFSNKDERIFSSKRRHVLWCVQKNEL